jgi:hypothetical protein
LRENDRLSNGITPNPLQIRNATNQCIAAAEVMLLPGHEGTNPLSTIACRLDLLTINTYASHGSWFLASIHRASQAREYAVFVTFHPG